jgi:putative ABC transport system substrate-binding protein
LSDLNGLFDCYRSRVTCPAPWNPLSAAKHPSLGRATIDAIDPKRTSTAPYFSPASLDTIAAGSRRTKMRRREFISVLGSAALLPMAARAQAGLPVIGYLSGRSVTAEAPLREPFLKSLEEAGFVVGRNIVIEYRHPQGRDNKMSELASELVGQQVAVLVATDNNSALAAKAATSTIPLVFGTGDDPVRLGLVASLNRPGGNATGAYVFTSRLGAKRLSLIRALLPKPGLIVFVVDPNNVSTATQLEEMQQAALAIGQPLFVLRVTNEAEAEAAFATMAQQKVSAVQYGATVFFQVINDRLVELAARHRVPASYEWREAVSAGGLMSYNANRTESAGQVGRYVAQILKGAKPVDLPVVQSSNFVFVINLKTAKALGFEIPAALLAQADEVIE